MKILKNHLVLLTLGSLLAATPLPAQNQPAIPGSPTGGGPIPAAAPAKLDSDLIPFDLDFPGGTPIQLVKAMEKAIGKPLNVIIPEEHASFKLPALKMNQVTAYQLFTTMELASQKGQVVYGVPQPLWQGQFTPSSGFRTSGNTTPRVWYFYHNKPSPPEPTPKQCRFYQLAPFLQATNSAGQKLKLEDITTAIETGWRMSQLKEQPELKFHKETQLLIVVGEPAHLAIIDDVLKELPRQANSNPRQFLPLPAQPARTP